MPTEPVSDTCKLPDLDLRRRVAEACGWTGITPHANPDDPELFGFPPPSRSGKQFGPRPIPPYELDIAAILSVVDSHGLYWAAGRALNGHWCVLDTKPIERDAWGDQGFGGNIALSICLAYLAWRASQ